ncbi:FAD-dependent oxidoreductase [Parahaliea mediterranea]|uniref:FAD-dependent oxidoreductase n=1 Tax=Parahaliea mediterranea TaxID=651086 RepID=A0A939DHL5_9GAMM|nr:bifunctional TVP38/TMEM64 family protein/FAD-dependent oxidoreductase [Parahaliea mediterranea]MBN7798249.1 FAD-dependent oxidoreductase [Parahaliea mediterranea]
MQRKRILVLLIIAALIGAWFVFGLGDLLRLEAVKAHVETLQHWCAARPLLAGALYLLAYIAVTALALPGAALMTLAGGALFGFWYALLLASFGSTIGGTLCFLVSRWLLRDWVQDRFRHQLRAINRGFARDGTFYLLTLRLVPLFPFFLVNLVMGLLPVGAGRFYWVSQLGMLPATAVFVNAGTQLGQLESAAGIMSPGLLLSFALLGLFPLVARRLVDGLRARRMYREFRRPRSFDTNLVVIGAGSAGLVTALIAATVKARVTLIERERMGGDCLNTGCVPSKALIRSARAARELRRATEFGLAAVPVRVDFATVMARVRGVIRRIEPHDSVERFTGLGVDCVHGAARLVSPWEVMVGERRITARHIVIASGARPRVPDVPGIRALDYLTSDTLWSMETPPRRLLVLGGGPIGCELAQAMARLDVQVTLVTRAERLLPREDPEVGELLAARFAAEGIEVHTLSVPVAFGRASGAQFCRFERGGRAVELRFDRLLVAAGRRANTEGLGLEALGIELAEDGSLPVDDFLRTRVPNILACGDVTGPFRFTHMASHQAWYAAVNALFGGWRRFAVDYSVVPWATFTDPEVARVGLSAAQAGARGLRFEVTRFDLAELDRALTDGEEGGFIKVLTPPGSDRILGATIVSAHAAELVNEFVMAMKHGIGLNRILGTIHIYPTFSEANKFLAGEWRKARKPERLLRWAQRYHAWRRG